MGGGGPQMSIYGTRHLSPMEIAGLQQIRGAKRDAVNQQTHELQALAEEVKELRLLVRECNYLIVSMMDGTFSFCSEQTHQFLVHWIFASVVIPEKYAELLQIWLHLSYEKEDKAYAFPALLAMQYGILPAACDVYKKQIAAKASMWVNRNIKGIISIYQSDGVYRFGEVGNYEVCKGKTLREWVPHWVDVLYTYYAETSTKGLLTWPEDHTPPRNLPPQRLTKPEQTRTLQILWAELFFQDTPQWEAHKVMQMLLAFRDFAMLMSDPENALRVPSRHYVPTPQSPRLVSDVVNETAQRLIGLPPYNAIAKIIDTKTQQTIIRPLLTASLPPVVSDIEYVRERVRDTTRRRFCTLRTDIERELQRRASWQAETPPPPKPTRKPKDEPPPSW
jgi:hypothetical protein